MVSVGDGVRLPALLVLLGGLAFWGWCVVDFATTDERDLRSFSRPVWAAILVFGSVVGAVAWLAVGRPERTGHR